MRTKGIKPLKKKSRRTKKLIFHEEDFLVPPYSIGDVIQKPGSKYKGYILDNHIPATDGVHLLIWDKVHQKLVDQRYQPKELALLGYEIVGRLKAEVLEKYRLNWVTGRSRYTTKQRRADHEEKALKKAIGSKLQRKEGRNEKEKPCKEQKRKFKRRVLSRRRR